MLLGKDSHPVYVTHVSSQIKRSVIEDPSYASRTAAFPAYPPITQEPREELVAIERMLDSEFPSSMYFGRDGVRFEKVVELYE